MQCSSSNLKQLSTSHSYGKKIKNCAFSSNFSFDQAPLTIKIFQKKFTQVILKKELIEG